jgi:hypothetical protein
MLSMLAELSDSDLLVLARLATYVSETETMNTMFYDLATFGIGTLNLKFDIPTELLLEVEDWYTEFALARLVIQVINKHLVYEELDFDLIWYGLRHYTDTVLFDYAWKWAVSLLPDAARAFIAGKGFEYLVGEYVQA